MAELGAKSRQAELAADKHIAEQLRQHEPQVPRKFHEDDDASWWIDRGWIDFEAVDLEKAQLLNPVQISLHVAYRRNTKRSTPY